MAFAAPLALAAGIVGAGITAAGTLEAGSAASAAANYRAQVATNNAITARQNADYAEKAGSVAGTTQSLKGAQVAGKIRAGQAAGGIDVNTGSAAKVAAGQRTISNLDTATTLNNSELTAYGYRTKAVSEDAQAKLDKMAGDQAITGSELGAAGGLISSASSLGSKWLTGGGIGGGGGSGGGSGPVYPSDDI